MYVASLAPHTVFDLIMIMHATISCYITLGHEFLAVELYYGSQGMVSLIARQLNKLKI